MVVKIEVVDGTGSGIVAGVTPTGEVLITGEGTLKNISQFQSMTTTNPFNFFGPIPGQQFVITSIVLDGPTGATVTIFEASSPSSSTIDKTLFGMNFRAAGQIAIPLQFGGFLPVTQGEYVNATTDTATVNLNIIGYYHPILFNPA